ncbi:hypothetical protein SELMODRAFT_416209 [Selaginella moellendorffii]|uniref:Helicase XPB/Ssl2 N-terminal domain-containing protein n=1 Tax=Selaginella moellendorffii TaxID=88036 RepID=D8RYF4_SELML|nr:hypothetical protein SELMODRAFT_416209 [Selaginella moellendorffii]
MGFVVILYHCVALPPLLYPHTGTRMLENGFSKLELKPDHKKRPLWVGPDGHIFLKTFSPLHKQAYGFLIVTAEPVCQPEHMHEYNLTPHPLYPAVSIGLETQIVITVMEWLSKARLRQKIVNFIKESTLNYGKNLLI